MPTVVPVIPPTPTADSSYQQWDIYLRAISEVNRAAHADAQQATAVAMQANVAAQQALVAAMSAPSELPTKAQLVFQMLLQQPQASVLTPTVIVKGATDIVDAFVAKFPAAVRL